MALAQLGLVCRPRGLRPRACHRGCVGYSRAVERERYYSWSFGPQREETKCARGRCGCAASLVRSLGHVKGAAVGAVVACWTVPGDVDGFVGVSTVNQLDLACGRRDNGRCGWLLPFLRSVLAQLGFDPNSWTSRVPITYMNHKLCLHNIASSMYSVYNTCVE